MAFPNTLDSFSNPSAGQLIQAVHVGQLNDAVEALEAKLGIDSGTLALGAAQTVQFGTSLIADHSAGTTSILHLRARGAADSKMLMRLMPQGTGESATTGDRAELTLLGLDIGETNRWWADTKVRERISDSVRFWHFLTDRNGTAEPITEVAFEIDGEGESTGVERFRIVRNAWIDSATGDTQVMFDLSGANGLQGLANTKIAINGLKIGPASSGADISLFLDDGTNRSALTRTTGANADLIVRNFGSGNIILRPADNPANDWLVGPGFLEAAEISDPAAPAANKGRLYFKDNGAGKTQLAVRFPTGAVQVVATEP